MARGTHDRARGAARPAVLVATMFVLVAMAQAFAAAAAQPVGADGSPSADSEHRLVLADIVVPEPATFGLLALGGVLAIFRRRR